MLEALYNNPELGTPLGNNVYIIRWQLKSKGKGKSGGIRVIAYYLSENLKLYLLNIYDKSEKESISAREIKQLIREIN